MTSDVVLRVKRARWAAGLLVVWLAGGTPAQAAQVTLQQGTGGYSGVADAWLDESDHDDNNGGDPTLRIQYNSGMSDHALLKFTLPSVGSSTVTAATLSLYYYDQSSMSQNNAVWITPYRITSNRAWYENIYTGQSDQAVNWVFRDEAQTLHWTSDYGAWYDKIDDANPTRKIKPEGGSVSDAIDPENWVDFNVQPTVSLWYGGTENNGFVLFESGFQGSGFIAAGLFRSRNYADTPYRPKLTITFSGASVAWNGNVNGAWDSSTANWTVGGVLGGLYGNGDHVTFPDGAATWNVTVAGGGVSPASTTINNSIGTYAFSGGSISGTGGLSKTESGAATLSVANGYGGATTVAGGVLKIRHANALGGTGSGTSVASGARLELEDGIAVGAEALTLNGTGGGSGALRNVSGANSWAGAVQLGAATEIQSDAGTLRLTGGIGGGGNDLTFDGAGATEVATVGISGVATTLTKTGSGALTLSTSSSYGGSTTVSGGKVIVSANNALGTADAGTTIANNTALWLLGGVNYSAAEPLSIIGSGADSGGALYVPSGANSFAGAVTMTGASVVGVAGSSSLTLSGGIGGGYTLTKSGAGQLAVSGNNTFSGNTVVSSGRLALTGSSGLASSPAIVVVGGAVLDVTGRAGGELPLGVSQTLTGAGTVDGAVNVLGTIAPGGSVGTLATGSETWQAAGQYACEIADLSRPAGSGSDLLAIGGDLTIAATPANPFTIRLISLSGSVPGPAPGFDPDVAFVRAIASVSGTLQDFAADKFAVNSAQFVNDLKGGVFGVTSGSLNLQFVPNRSPVALDTDYLRRSNTTLKIKISRLVQDRTSDPDGDARELMWFSPASAKGVPIRRVGDYFLYETSLNDKDTFQYRVRDVRHYRPGDTVRTATATLTVRMVDDNAPSQNIVDFRVIGGKPHLAFSGIPGFQYEIQRTTDLLANPIDWTRLDTVRFPEQGVYLYIDDDPPPEDAYYRTMETW